MKISGKTLGQSAAFRKLVGALVIYAVIQILLATGLLSDYYFATIVTIGINVILAVSLNLITGFTGQFSLGHAGFMSIGAYFCAFITLRVEGIPGFLLGILVGGCAAALVGVLVGLPTLRLRGDYLAIATLGMAEIIRIIFQNIKITNGAAGLSNLPQYVNWPWLFLFIAAVVALTVNFLHSSPGRACIAIREDEIAAEAMGINTTRYKVTAFIIGAFCAGVAGALYATYFPRIKPDTFGFMKSVDILVIVVFGGLGSITGSILGAIVLGLISMFLSSYTELRMVLYALRLVISMIFRPQGLRGSRELSLALMKRAGDHLMGLFRKKEKEGRV